MPNDQLPIDYDPATGIPLTPLALPVDDGPNPIAAKLFGIGQERYQLWPERMIRSAVTLPGDVTSGQLPILDPQTGRTSEKVIERAQDLAGMAGGGLLLEKPGVATLGSGAVRQAPKAAEIAPAFYSGLERAVETAKPTIATADQWLGYLKNQPGVKSEELATVLKELPSGPITKEALGNIVKTNKVELGEVVKNQDGVLNEAMREKELDRFAEDRFGDSFDNLLSHQQAEILNELPNKGGDTKFHQYQLPGGPLSRDTEILTKSGWKRIDYVSIGEEIITRKDENGELEWQPIQAIPTVYAEKLYHFYNQSIDMQVTANHKMVVRKLRRSSKGIFRITAEQLWATSECVIPLTGNWTGKGSKTLFGSDACDVAEFIGWYLAEGSYKHKNGIKNTIQIAQCRNHNPENCDRLEALFDRLGLVWKYYGNGYGVGSKGMTKELLQLLHNQPISEGKFIPPFFFTENKFVINALLDGLILGGGHTKEEGFDNYGSFRQARKIFFSKSKLLADGVQILALLSGYRASVRKRPTGIYVVGINSKDWNSVDDAKHAIVDYHDTAYCVTVENHCIYVRRNGVAAFTGNSDYKEMLLTLPDKSKITYDNIAKEIGYSKPYDQLSTRGQSIVDNFYIEKMKNNQIPEFRSSHWEEPNVLAHIRMNDRTVEGNKTLHLEEIQSDWHQKGRKEGYKLNPDEKARLDKNAEAVDNKLTAANAEDIMGNPDLDAGLKQAVERKILTQKEAEDYKHLVKNENGTTPDAPFKKNWDELALKKMIHKAASEGYEGISWTPGEAQAARYDLSKQVKGIHWQPSIADKNATLVQINPVGGNPLKLQVDKKGNVVSSFPASQGGQFEGKNLADIVGKEHAEKILNKADGSLEGDGLKIGGEGMKSFYDKMLVDRANNLAKKYGGKVEQKEIKAAPTYETKNLSLNKNGEEIVSVYKDGVFMADMEKSEAAHYIAERKKTDKASNVHYLHLTPELKKKALEEGFPLFSSAPIITPVDHDPFEKKKYKLKPVAFNPFEKIDPHAQMLEDRSNTVIRTIDPGRDWNGLDKNVIDPSVTVTPFQEDV